jgi:hypothetical protein
MVIAAQDLAVETSAAAVGVVPGVADALYVALGKRQKTIRLANGMAVGFAMVMPAAAIAFAVLSCHPRAAGRRVRHRRRDPAPLGRHYGLS